VWQWEEYVRRLEREEATRAVCIQHRMVDGKRAAFMETSGIDTYCWTVDDAGKAVALVTRGVEGVISNDLALLAGLRSEGARTPTPPPVEG
jgi:glycerophosphoryl diester phosphodiesterase